MTNKTSMFTGFIFLVMTLGIAYLLLFTSIPDTNRDIIMMIVGAFVAQIPNAINKLFGDEPEQLKELKSENAKLKEKEVQLSIKVRLLETQVELFRAELDDFKTRFLEKTIFKDEARKKLNNGE